MKNSEQYRLIFSEIINGYSNSNHSFFGPIFIKHPTYLEISEMDISYNNFLNEAKNKGLPTYKQREESIIKEGLWTQNDETNLAQNERFIQDLKINYSKDYLNSRRVRMKKEIEEGEIRLDGFRLKKDHAIGATAESFANRKLTYTKILQSYFKDKQLTAPLINDEELDDKNYDELIKLYNDYQNKIGEENLKYISISGFFTNIFYLSSDNAHDFYGKPILELTNHQATLFSLGRYFKSVLSQNENIPKEISSNPDELINWIEIQRNATDQKIINTSEDNSDGGGGSIVGATKEDYKLLGIQVDTNSMSRELKKAGGYLGKDKLFELTS
jgi:hypothetical protein